MPDGTELLEVIGHASDILGVVIPAVSLIGAVVNWFETSPATSDPIIAALSQVNSALSDLQEEVLASWASTRQDNLSFLTATSTAALRTAFEFMQSGKAASDAEWAPKIALAERDSLVAVQTFVGDLDGGYWLRPYSLKAISQNGDPMSYSDGWMSYIADRPNMHPLNTVWDYRWALPATVYAITARIVVLRLTGTSMAAAISECRQYNEFIANVYKRMDGGIKRFQPPGAEPEHVIRTDGIPIAVADIYGGYYIGGRFDTNLSQAALRNRPYPTGEITPYRTDMPSIVSNANLITDYWRNKVAISVGLSGLLSFAGTLETSIHPPTVSSNSISIFYGGNGDLGGSHPSLFGVFYRVSPNGNLHWYRYDGSGENDPSGRSGWHANTANPIGNGWGNFRFLLGAGNGVIISVEPNGDMRWHCYVGEGEIDATGHTGWASNSGNQIGNGWNNFNQLFVQPPADSAPMVIYGVLPNGDLVWHSYSGKGENDPTGRAGWLPNSGNRIGNGWQTLRLFGSSGAIFGVLPNGELRWYSYEGDGTEDVSGSTDWNGNSGNLIATGWDVYRQVFCGISPGGFGHVIYAVDNGGALHWFYYDGTGESDPGGHKGWERNSGNVIGNGW